MEDSQMADVLLKQFVEGKKVKKLIAFLLVGMFFLLGCANKQNLTEEEKEAFRRGKMRYDASRGP